MTAQPANMNAFIDACRDSVAREIANVRHQASQERELRDAQFAVRMAEFEARISAVSELERKMADRLSTLKDGEPGRDGRDGVDGQAGEPGKDGNDGRDGVDGMDGSSVTMDDVAPLVTAEVERILSTWERPKDGEPGKDGRDGVDGKDGAPGERGEPGPVGALPIVSDWQDRVYYEGECCGFDGSVWQARADTGKQPGHDDWVCLVRRGSDGRDGQSFTVRGTFAEDAEYAALDVVALNGASFVARRDNPGMCPGDGWQLMAAQGKTGKPGMKGDSGVGIRGLPGPGISAMEITGEGLLTIRNADGTVVECDLYPLLVKLSR